MKGLRGVFSAGAGLSLGAGLLYFAFRDVHAAELWASLKSFEWAWAPVLVALPVLDLYIRALRWRILLTPLADARPWKLLQLESVGLALNNILFMRLGELARALLTGLELDAHAMAVFATIVVERLCDSGALMALFAVASMALGDEVRMSLRVVAACLAVGVAVALALAVRLETTLVRLAHESALSRWPAVTRLIEDLAAGTRGLRAPGAWWRVAGWSVVLWVVDAAVFWTAARALDLDPPLDFGAAVVVVATAAGATALPAAPGGFGNFEAAVKWVLVRFGSDPGDALAFAAFTHLAVYAVVTTLGIVFLYRLGHTVESLKAAVARLKEHGPHLRRKS